MNFFTRNSSIHFKKCQNFQTKNEFNTSFNLVDRLKLEYQLKSISLPRGFSGSVQFSSSNSKNVWRNSLKSGVHFKEIVSEQNHARDFSKNVRFLYYEVFSIFSVSFKGNKNLIKANISKKKKVRKNRGLGFLPLFIITNWSQK